MREPVVQEQGSPVPPSVAQDAASQYPEFGPDDFVGEPQPDGSWLVYPTNDALRREVAEDIQGVGPTDLVVTGQGADRQVVVSEDARRERALEQFVAESPADREDIADVQLTDEGATFQFTEDYRREQATQQALSGLHRDQRPLQGLSPGAAVGSLVAGLDESDLNITLTGDGAQVSVAEDTQRDLLRQRAASQTDDFGPQDFVINETDQGLQATVSGEAIQEHLAEQEQKAETAGVEIPEWAPLVGGAEVAGQHSDVDVQRGEDGEVTVEQQERFGDFDFGAVPESFTYTMMGGGTTEVNVPGGGGEFEDVTGEIGDRLIGAGEGAGDFLARELVEERTVLPGAVVEEQLTGDTDFVASATRGVPVGAASIGDQALNLPQEAAEFTAEGLSRTAEGEGLEFGGEVADAAVGTGILMGQEARADPGGFTGQLAGSAVGTVGGLTAARIAGGPRAARAASATVQPVEELAIGAARTGLVSNRAATLVPGVRSGHIGDTSTEASTETDTEASGTLDFNLRERVSSRTPNVRVESDPEAGVLEVDPELRQAVAERVQKAPAQARARVGAAGSALAEGAVSSARRTVQPVRSRVADSEFLADVETGRAQPAAVRTPGIDRPSLGFDRLRGLSPSTPKSAFLSDVGTARARPFAAETPGLPEFGVSRPDVGLPASQFLQAEGTGRAQPFAAETPGLPSLGSSRPGLSFPESQFLGAEGTARAEPFAAETPSLPSLEFGVGGLAARAGSGVGRLGEGVDDFIIGAQRGPSVTGDVALQQAFLRGSDLPYPTFGQAARSGRRQARRAAEGASELSASIGDFGRQVALRTPTRSGDVALQQAFLRGSDLPFPSRPSVSAPALGALASREATAARFRLAEAGERGRETLSNFGDLTIRIGDADPATIFDTDVDEPAIRSQLDNPLGLEGDTRQPAEGETDDEAFGGDFGTSESGSGFGDPIDTSRTGVGFETEVTPRVGQRLITRSETETETETEPASPEVEQSQEWGRRLQEAEAAVTGEGVGLEDDTQEAQMPEVGIETGFADVGVGRAGIRTRTEPMGRTETRTEVRTELQQEQRLETRQEQRLELDTRLETRPEPLELGDPGFDDNRFQFFDDRDVGGGLGDPADGDLRPGWLTETFFTVATGGTETPQSPSQSVLEGQPSSLLQTGELPVEFQNDEQEQAFQEVRELFDPGAGEASGDGLLDFDGDLL